jgi:hypothetical protein
VVLPLVQIGRALNEPSLPLWRAARRLRCRQCGQPVRAELLSGVDGRQRAGYSERAAAAELSWHPRSLAIVTRSSAPDAPSIQIISRAGFSPPVEYHP